MSGLEDSVSARWRVPPLAVAALPAAFDLTLGERHMVIMVADGVGADGVLSMVVLLPSSIGWL